MNLFIFYKLSFFVAGLSGLTLSIIGKHFLSRGNILEIFLLSQFAIIGNLFSKLFFHHHGTEFFSLLFSYIFFGIGKFMLHQFKLSNHEKGSYMVGGYLLLLSIQYLIIGYFPQLDSHMSIGFFGNMVTASMNENITSIITFSIFIIIYIFNRKKINKRTIEINILNSKDNSKIDLFLFTLPLISSLYGLGFLYTMSFLLLPVLLVGKDFSTEKKATLSIVLISVISSVLGLALSILFERLSTSSLQIVLLFIILFSSKFAKPLIQRKKTVLNFL